MSRIFPGHINIVMSFRRNFPPFMVSFPINTRVFYGFPYPDKDNPAGASVCQHQDLEPQRSPCLPLLTPYCTVINAPAICSKVCSKVGNWAVSTHLRSPLKKSLLALRTIRWQGIESPSQKRVKSTWKLLCQASYN